MLPKRFPFSSPRGASWRRRFGVGLFSALLALGGSAAAVAIVGCGGEGDEDRLGSMQDAVQLVFTYGSEKEKWLEAVTEEFNRRSPTLADGRPIFVEAIPMGSGQSIDEVITENRQAHLVSPASAAFIELGNAESRAQTGDDLIGRTQNLVLSPVVIAMWQPMAETLGWGERSLGWSDILELAQDPDGWASLGHPEWGTFKLGHTHPDFSNSGLISLFAEVYAATGKTAGLTREDVDQPATADFLRGIESSIVHYGSSTGFFGRKMFANGPSYLSAAVLYENMIIESYRSQQDLPFPVVAIYPKEGTFWSDHPVGVVNRPWVQEEHREAAQIYIDWLLEPERQLRALDFGFRPANVEVPLGEPVTRRYGVNPEEPQTTLEVPTPEVMQAIRELWQRNKKRSEVTLVLDTSGSMREEERMANAKAGAQQLLDMLSDEDYFSLLTFADQSVWVAESVRLGSVREDVHQRIEGVFANGGTRLYDSVIEAYRAQQLQAQRGSAGERIQAIVVLTDGEDTRSEQQQADVLSMVDAGSEGVGVRIFTIGYSPDVNADALENIADASRAKFYQGDPRTIRNVFREISTFF
ncbi:MAG: VWA domain-containing protein [Acidobacteriota bacterium]